MVCKTLEDLWNVVHEINERHFPGNKLLPVVGNGKTCRPKAMFVFINPTIRNISSGKEWRGQRYPFIGTKQMWKVLHKAGLFDDMLMYRIKHSGYWSLDLADKVLKFLKQKSFYLTNIVKWTGHDSALPDSEKIKLFLPVLEKEIEIIQPEYVIAFGLIPFENLTKQKIKLNDYHSSAVKNKELKSYEIQIGQFKTKVIPCYFPVGRGNPKKAADILRMFKDL